MKIHRPELINDGENVKIQCYFEYAEGSDFLWYSLDKKYSKYLVTEKLDGFLIGLLIFAMKKGEDIYLDWPVSEKLFFNLSNYYIKILAITTSLKPVKIYPSSLDNGTSYPSENAVATGFSGGVDSFCTIYERLFKKNIPESYKITHFIFNNAGSHGEFDIVHGRKLFNERYEMLKSFPEEIDKDFIKIDSNISDILNINFELTNTPRNLSAVLLLQKLFSKYYYASSYNYLDCFVGASDTATSFSDPITLSLLSTETLEFIPDGSQYTRVEKTEIIADFNYAHKYLNVCFHEGENCSVCSKCGRTLLTLEILGKIEKFKNVFNLDKYNLFRNGYIINLLKKKETALNKEILDFAKSKNYSFPIKNKIKSLLPHRFIAEFREFSRL